MEPTTSLSEIIDEKVAFSSTWTHYAFHHHIVHVQPILDIERRRNDSDPAIGHESFLQ